MGNPYETGKLLSEYLLFHYGTEEEILGEVSGAGILRPALHFPVRTVAHFGDDFVARGLDLGCAVGRSTFEMAKHCGEVIGADYSKSFVDTANLLRQGECVAYARLDEGHVSTPLEVRAPKSAGNVRFETGDAMNLRADLGTFDRVHAANLLCRLSEPQRLLKRLPELVRPGGELVLATPCTWLADYTPPENWPPGATLDWLHASLDADFEAIRQCDEMFLIRETARKFQLTTSLVTVWRRRSHRTA